MSTQKAKLANFISITNASKADATRILKESDWNLEHAMDAFYSSANTVASTVSSSAAAAHNKSASDITSLFDAYKEEGMEMIKAEGTERLCNDLDLEPTDPVTLVLSWHMKCETACEFMKDTFTQGCKDLNVTNLEGLKAAIPRMRGELKDPRTAKQIYHFTFSFGRTENQKNLDLGSAIFYWNCLVKDRFPQLALWNQFLTEKHGKSISKDTWNLFWDFITTCEPNFEGHDLEGGAWPVTIDNFVEWYRENHLNTTSTDTTEC